MPDYSETAKLSHLLVKLFLPFLHLLVIWSNQLKHFLDFAPHVAADATAGLILVNIHYGLAMWGLCSNAFMYMHKHNLCNDDGAGCHSFPVQG